MSRRKGLRVEYLIRDHLRELGYKADRVPSSGAAEGFKGDVECSKDGNSFKVECKARKSDFDTIYRVYMAFRDENRTFRFEFDGTLVAVGMDFEDVKRTNGVFFQKHDLGAKKNQTLRKIVGLKKLLGECQYLAIKGNNRSILFLRYW